VYKRQKERPGDIKHSLAYVDDTKKTLGFAPKYDLMQGLKLTIEYFVNLFKNGAA
jgi:nucleoside-diphosphate-sugar epimerase